ncbi:hypothetical protein [Undibacterium sp. GrIS 1.2]|uniref:hypothetical protein n=1 Tax=Undibacterium sp. GrIS 1.2 TaxID=3143933 RepID=UPI003398D678
MDLTRISKPKQAVIADAVSAGYMVEHCGDSAINLVRFSKHVKPRLLRGLRIFADGTAYDLMVDLSCAKTIRSAEIMRNTLGLSK